MPYGQLFDDVDTNLPPNKQKVATKDNSRQSKGNWSDTDNPILTESTLFGEYGPCQPQGTEDEIKEAKIRAMCRRHELRQPLHHPDDHKKDVNYFDAIMALSIEMQVQILAMSEFNGEKDLSHYASGVFQVNPRDASDGYRVQVWDNVIGKKIHVCYADYRWEAEDELRKFWLNRRGVDIAKIAHEQMPPYILKLLEEAKDTAKYATRNYGEDEHRRDMQEKERLRG